MDAIPWMVVISLVILFLVLACKVVFGAAESPPKAMPAPAPKATPSPDYLRRWSPARRWNETVAREDWGREFDRLLGPAAVQPQPAPQPRPKPQAGGKPDPHADVYARLRSQLGAS